MSERSPLYLREAEVAKRELGKEQASQWPEIAAVLEREHGLPSINPVIGMRYWPSVRTWFDRYEKTRRPVDAAGRVDVTQLSDAELSAIAAAARAEEARDDVEQWPSPTHPGLARLDALLAKGPLS